LLWTMGQVGLCLSTAWRCPSPTSTSSVSSAIHPGARREQAQTCLWSSIRTTLPITQLKPLAGISQAIATRTLGPHLSLPGHPTAQCNAVTVTGVRAPRAPTVRDDSGCYGATKLAWARRPCCATTATVEMCTATWITSARPISSTAASLTPGGGNTPTFRWGTNPWGIWCMNCHGGDSLGGLHGSSRGVGQYGQTPLGKRFMNGAFVEGWTAASGTQRGTCWAKCHMMGSKRYRANYDYPP